MKEIMRLMRLTIKGDNVLLTVPLPEVFTGRRKQGIIKAK